MSSSTAAPAAGSADQVQLSLDLVDLTIGGLQIISDVSFDVRRGELLALIGPNGAGKTSLLNCLSGIYHPTGGRIRFGEHDLNRIKPHHAAGLGLARTFQHAEMFEHMSVLENLLVGRHILMRRGILSNGLFWGPTLKEEVAHREAVEEVIDFLELERYRQAEATGLPYGVQKIVGLGRALVMNPEVLLLDEPSAGMNRQEKEDLARFILRIKHEIGTTMIWVEHDMQLVGDLADRVVVLNFGTKIAEGEPDEVLTHPEVVQAYIGVSAP
jgi:branched-chain amino acid transport system ATP-binding protein